MPLLRLHTIHRQPIYGHPRPPRLLAPLRRLIPQVILLQYFARKDGRARTTWGPVR